MFKPVGILLLLPVVLLTQDTTPTIAPQDSHHWRKLEKVCETGRKTYGANEFVENGRVCRWTFVPYWPEKK